MLLNYIRLKDVKPVLSGYLSESLSLLNLQPFPDDEAIHDIRVLMKKSRATIRLLVSYLDDVSFKREYAAFREAGRMLSTWRDTSVHRKTLKSLRKGNKRLFSALAGNMKIAELLARSQYNEGLTGENREKLDKVTGMIRKSAYRFRFYSLDKPDPEMLFKQLESTYSIVAGIYLECRNKPRPEKLHELRKRTKDFLYQLYFFRPLNPAVIKVVEKRLENLAQNLGKYNDLTQLLSKIEYKSGDPENTPELDELAVVIRGVQDIYLSKIWPAAFKILRPGEQLVKLLGIRVLIM